MVAPPLLKYECELNMKRYCQSYEYDLCWNLTKYMYSSILLIYYFSVLHSSISMLFYFKASVTSYFADSCKDTVLIMIPEAGAVHE